MQRHQHPAWHISCSRCTSLFNIRYIRGVVSSLDSSVLTRAFECLVNHGRRSRGSHLRRQVQHVIMSLLSLSLWLLVNPQSAMIRSGYAGCHTPGPFWTCATNTRPSLHGFLLQAATQASKGDTLVTHLICIHMSGEGSCMSMSVVWL